MDKDFPNIDGLNEGLHQYYEIEQTTDLWSFNIGRVQEKMGANEKPFPEKTPVSFVLLDNSHLNEHGIRYFCAKSKEFVLITSNKNHLAYSVKEANLNIIYQEELSLETALTILKLVRIWCIAGGAMEFVPEAKAVRKEYFTALR